jgi:hypothetical protein
VVVPIQNLAKTAFDFQSSPFLDFDKVKFKLVDLPLIL